MVLSTGNVAALSRAAALEASRAVISASIRVRLTSATANSPALSLEIEQTWDDFDADGVVDAYYAKIFNDVLSLMRANPDNVFRATRVQSISKYIERIGDHATNIAERVIFILTADDIRHAARMRRDDFS